MLCCGSFVCCARTARFVSSTERAESSSLLVVKEGNRQYRSAIVPGMAVMAKVIGGKSRTIVSGSFRPQRRGIVLSRCELHARAAIRTQRNEKQARVMFNLDFSTRIRTPTSGSFSCYQNSTRCVLCFVHYLLWCCASDARMLRGVMFTLT